MKKSLQSCASKRHYLSNPRRESGVMGRHYSSHSLEEATPCHTANGKSLTVCTLCPVVSRIPFAAGRCHHLSKRHSCREESRSCISAPTLTCGVIKVSYLRYFGDEFTAAQHCASKRHYLSNPRRESGVMGRHYSSHSLEEATPCHTANGKSLTVCTLCPVVSRIPFAAGRCHHLSKRHSCREESRSCISAPTLTCGVIKVSYLRYFGMSSQ